MDKKEHEPYDMMNPRNNNSVIFEIDDIMDVSKKWIIQEKDPNPEFGPVRYEVSFKPLGPAFVNVPVPLRHDGRGRRKETIEIDEMEMRRRRMRNMYELDTEMKNISGRAQVTVEGSSEREIKREKGIHNSLDTDSIPNKHVSNICKCCRKRIMMDNEAKISNQIDYRRDKRRMDIPDIINIGMWRKRTKIARCKRGSGRDVLRRDPPTAIDLTLSDSDSSGHFDFDE